MEMEVCVWGEGGYDRTFVSEPSNAEVTEMLRLLDGTARNDLYLRSGSGPWMGFGGGPGQVTVTYSEAEEGPHYQAVGAERDDREEPVRMVVGGQEVELPSRFLIDIDSAIPAAVTFGETGRQPETLIWEPC